MTLHSLKKSLHTAQSSASNAYSAEQSISSMHVSGSFYNASAGDVFLNDAKDLYSAGQEAIHSNLPSEEKADILGDLEAAIQEMIDALWEQCENAIANAWAQAENSFNDGQDTINGDYLQDAISEWEDWAGDSWPDVDFGEYVSAVENAYDGEVWMRAFSETTNAPLGECMALQKEAMRLQAMLDALEAADDISNAFEAGLDGEPTFEDFTGELADDEKVVQDEIDYREEVKAEMKDEMEEMRGEMAEARGEEGMGEEERSWLERAAEEEEAWVAEDETATDITLGAAEYVTEGEIVIDVIEAGAFVL